MDRKEWRHTTSRHAALVWVLVWSWWLRSAQAMLDFYMSAEQAEQLYGIRTQGVYYIRDGVRNQYAVSFQNQVVPGDVSRLVFHWRSDVHSRVAYSLRIAHSADDAMQKAPYANVSSTGFVPETDQAFQIDFPCTGVATAEVGFLIQVKFAFGSSLDTEDVDFKRRKLCLASEATSASPSASTTVEVVVPGEVDAGSRMSPETSTVLALGAASGTVALVGVLLTVMYVTRKRRVGHHPGGLDLGRSGLHSHEDYAADHRRRMLRINARMNRASAMGGSYATLTSAADVFDPTTHLMLRFNGDYSAATTSTMWSSLSMSRAGELGKSAAATSSAVLPAQKSLVLENGVLRLLPNQSSASTSEPHLSSRFPSPRAAVRSAAAAATDGPDGHVEAHLDTVSATVAAMLRIPNEGDVAVTGATPYFLYPHLMPQNIMQAQKRVTMPRSTSGGSVLV